MVVRDHNSVQSLVRITHVHYLKGQDVADQRQRRKGHAKKGSVIQNNGITAGNTAVYGRAPF